MKSVEVRILPFGTVYFSIVINSPADESPEKPSERDSIKPINGTTAHTRIISVPIHSPIFS